MSTFELKGWMRQVITEGIAWVGDEDDAKQIAEALNKGGIPSRAYGIYVELND